MIHDDIKSIRERVERALFDGWITLRDLDSSAERIRLTQEQHTRHLETLEVARLFGKIDTPEACRIDRLLCINHTEFNKQLPEVRGAIIGFFMVLERWRNEL